MLYREDLDGGLVIQSMMPEFVVSLEKLQQIVFPSLAPEELFSAQHYLKHLELFPEGQFVVLDKQEPIASTTTMLYTYREEEKSHTFADMIAGGWLTSHNPDGEWLYGLDISVRPDYRGRGLARHLYRARQRLAQKLHLKGQMTVGMISGYGALKHQMTPEAYYEKLLRKEIYDPTVSVQMKMGFEPSGLIHHYVNDEICGNCGVFLTITADKDI